MCAYSFCVWISLHMALCAQSFLVSNRVALWDGRSLTLSVESKKGRVNVSGPAHHTDTLLLSIFSQAEHERKEKRHTQTQGTKRRARRDFSLMGEGQDGLLIYARGVYLGDYRGWGGSVCALLEVQFVHVYSLN